MAECGYNRAWIGDCHKEATEPDGHCKEHAGKVCISCGEPATRECPHTGIQFVCGYPLCDGCDHGIPDPDKPGLFNLGGGHHKKEIVRQQWERQISSDGETA